MDQYIHVALVGAVSAGKSTLLNALLVARYSDMSMQRTTANEIIYYETGDNGKTVPSAIHALNQSANRKIMDMTERGGELKITDIQKIEYYVPRVCSQIIGWETKIRGPVGDP
jgi:GTPase Era involved in 16S rRNA processing